MLTFAKVYKMDNICGTSLWDKSALSTILEIRLCDFAENKWSGRRGSNSQLSAWEAEFSILYFQYLQNRSEKMYVPALHAVHAVPDLRIARDVWGTVLDQSFIRPGTLFRLIVKSSFDSHK